MNRYPVFRYDKCLIATGGTPKVKKKRTIVHAMVLGNPFFAQLSANYIQYLLTKFNILEGSA
jgi:hypothetical protein